MFDVGDGEPTGALYLSHPFSIAFREVVIDGDNMPAASAPARYACRHGGRQRLTFTRGHFRDAAIFEGKRAGDLDKIGSLANFSVGHLSNYCEGGVEIVASVASEPECLSQRA